jgi:hypothetical protein
MFIKELSLYVDYLKNKVGEMAKPLTEKNEKYVVTFHKNLNEGIEYYRDLFNKKAEQFQDKRNHLIHALDNLREDLNEVKLKVMGVLN